MKRVKGTFLLVIAAVIALLWSGGTAKAANTHQPAELRCYGARLRE